VTVLFADVVGSTRMGEQLDPEEVAEIMDGAFAFLNAEVAKYGGTVARLLGDAVLAFFGAPVAHEDDAERAVRAGLNIQAKAKEYAKEIKRNYGVDFEMRVGINTGLAVLAAVGDEIKTEYTAMGDTTNLAARMQSAAKPSTVLISADTYHLVKNLFDLDPRGALKVKGKSALIETYEVLAPKTLPGRVRGLEGVSSPLVGRDADLQLLRDKLEGLLAGQGAFVAVVGEAGLGKSRLIAEVRKLVNSDSQPKVVWLEGRAISYGQSTVYYPWRQVVREAVGIQEGDAPDTVRERLRLARDRYGLRSDDLPFLEALLGVESEASLRLVRDLEGDALRQRIAEAMRHYIGALAQTVPAILVFDDLHWADEASVELLLNVAELVEIAPLLVICLMRPDKDAPSWSTIESVHSKLSTRFSEIMLEPLDAEHSRELLGNLLDIEDLPESVHEVILQKAEGNPFFVEEVIRTLIDSQHIVRENNHWRATREIMNVAIPDTLTGLLSARIDRLPNDTKEVAQTSAVLGRIFAYRALAEVCAAAPPNERVEDVKPHLGTLTYEELVRERARDLGLEYIFKHALTQEAAYNLLLIRRRKELHRRTGAVLEQVYAERMEDFVPALAHHFWLGEDWARAAEYSMRAGARAMKVYALSETLDHYDRACQALEKAPDAPPEKLIDATVAWAEVALKLKLDAAILERLARAEQLARDLQDKPRLAQALAWTAHAHALTGFPSRAIPILAESHQLATEVGDERLAMFPGFMIMMSQVERDPRGNLMLEQIINLAHTHHHKEIEAHALAVKGWAQARIGEFAQAEEDLRRAQEIAPATNSLVKQSDVNIFSSFSYFEMGDPQRAVEHGRRAAEQAMAVQGLECGTTGMFALGLGHLQAQNLGEAVTTLEEAARLMDTLPGMKDFMPRVRATHAIARLLSGHSEALDELEQALAHTQALGDQYWVAFISQYLGEAHTELGDLGRAEEYFNAAAAYYQSTGMYPSLARVLQSLGMLYERQGRAADAAHARAEVQSLASQLHGPAASPERSPQ
jgi:class 3 adenylate cyclase/tetratricopeptide (TPR) repeat protein/ABC-type iron transport system FetAB ATPase subunit